MADLIHVAPDYGSRPWQIVKDLFGFRNDIAHGKPESLRSEKFVDSNEFLDGELGEPIRTEWERFCTEENAVKAKEDVEKIAIILYEKADMEHKAEGPIGPFCFGFQVHGAEL